MKDKRAADYVIAVDSEFGAGHLQHAVLPGTVSYKTYLFTLEWRKYSSWNYYHFSFEITDWLMNSSQLNSPMSHIWKDGSKEASVKDSLAIWSTRSCRFNDCKKT